MTPNDYRILVSHHPERPTAQLYSFSLRQTLPAIPVPLKSGAPEPLLNLPARALRRAIDSDRPLEPPLSALGSLTSTPPAKLLKPESCTLNVEP